MKSTYLACVERYKNCSRKISLSSFPMPLHYFETIAMTWTGKRSSITQYSVTLIFGFMNQATRPVIQCISYRSDRFQMFSETQPITTGGKRTKKALVCAQMTQCVSFGPLSNNLNTGRL